MQSFLLIVLTSLGFILITNSQPTCPEWLYWGAPSPFDRSPNPLTKFMNATINIEKAKLPKDEEIKEYKRVIKKFCRVGHPLIKNETHKIYQTWSTCYHNYKHPINLYRMLYFSWMLNFMCDNQDKYSKFMSNGEMDCYSRKDTTSKCRGDSIIKERMNEPFNLCTQLSLSWEEVECNKAEMIKCGKVVEELLNYQAERVSKCNGTNMENFHRSIQFQL